MENNKSRIWYFCIVFVLLIMLMASCSFTCSKDAKRCSDGSSVGRDPFNDCEFFPCPEDNQVANPASVYCEEQGGNLELITQEDGGQIGMCNLPDGTQCEEWAFYRGDCPSDSTDTDDNIDEDEQSEDEPSEPDKDSQEDDAQEKHFCTPEQREAEACTMQYDPVCGWFDEQKKCIKCAATYGNACQACADEQVDYWTSGPCAE